MNGPWMVCGWGPHSSLSPLPRDSMPISSSGRCGKARVSWTAGNGRRAPGSEQLLPATRPRRAEDTPFPGLSLESWDGAPYNCRVEASPDQ